MQKYIKRSIDHARVALGDHYQKQAANRNLKSIESFKGVTDKKYIKLSDEYAVDVLGWKGYAPWLYVYSAFNSEFKEGWIPENYYKNIIVPKLQGEYGKVSELKNLSKRLLQSNLFPDLAYYVNGCFFDESQKIIKKERLEDFLFKDSDKIVFKIDNSEQGKGVSVFTKSTFSIEKICSMGNGVFQSFINQHSFFDKYMPNSVATIRLHTIIDYNGDAQVKSCYLRLGMNKDTHIQSSTTIRLAVDIDSGELGEIGLLPNWGGIIKEHPDTKVSFAKNIIPCFDQCKEVALSLQRRMSFVRSIGWDMVIDKENQIQVMEWNGFFNGIKFPEILQGPCYSDLGWENLWKK